MRNRRRTMAAHHASSSFTNFPQTVYLLLKWSIHPWEGHKWGSIDETTFSLTIHVLSTGGLTCEHEELLRVNTTYISDGVKSSSLSKGLSRPVSISERQSSAWNHLGGFRQTFVKRLFSHSARSVPASKVGVHSLLDRCKLGLSVR